MLLKTLFYKKKEGETISLSLRFSRLKVLA